MAAWSHTDDLRIAIDPDRTIDELCDLVLDWTGEPDTLLDRLTNDFALHLDDALLAIDRAHGGLFRARTLIAENEPGQRDPVARSAWDRFHRRRRPTPPRRSEAWRELVLLVSSGAIDDALLLTSAGFAALATPAEADAAGAWAAAISARGGTRVLGSVDAVVRLGELVALGTRAGLSPSHRSNTLIQLATALSSAIEPLTGSSPATPGSAAWLDAVRLAREARTLASHFEALGDLDRAASALELRRRAVVHPLGQCFDRVGPAMLDLARMAARLGDGDVARSLSEAVVADFSRLLDAPERLPPRSSEEAIRGLRSLREAALLRAELGGPPATELRTRIDAAVAMIRR